MALRLGLRVASATLIAALAAGCSVGGQPQAAPAPAVPQTVTQTVTATEQLPTTITETSTVAATDPVFTPPAGFDDWGDRVGARWSDQTTFTCADSSDSCWGVDLYTERGCAGGILVVLDVYRDDTKLTVIDGKTDPVAPDATTNLVLGQAGNGAELTAKIADIRCLAG